MTMRVNIEDKSGKRELTEFRLNCDELPKVLVWNDRTYMIFSYSETPIYREVSNYKLS